MTNHSSNNAEQDDKTARDRIKTELHCNFMVEAAAGTGKTTCIVNRMVQLVAKGACDVDRLVAVTFTRKAAAELRDRFQTGLRRAATEASSSSTSDETQRLQAASDHCGRAFVGTIHSFCASLLRERPIEFGVDPSFRELEEAEDAELREQAWRMNLQDLLATKDPLMEKLHELGLEPGKLKDCFRNFIEYRDVHDWPCEPPASFELESTKARVVQYIEHMKELIPSFPVERGKDELMNRYEEIGRAYRGSWSSRRHFFKELQRFDTSSNPTQKNWPNKIGKRESNAWKEFRKEIVKPAFEWWNAVCYDFVIDFMKRAGSVYAQLKAATMGLDFTDILIAVANGLRTNSRLRSYFQGRFTHLLVDEFQDTDPIQAEIILYLTSEDPMQQNWLQCSPKPGALFLVGDPKQSIYRFRRGDIETYNRVKAVFEKSGGEVLKLAKNFRSHSSIREWINEVFSNKFPPVPTRYKPAAEDMIQGREDCNGELHGVFMLDLSNRPKDIDLVAFEAEKIARFIRHAIDSGLTVPRTKVDLALGRTPQVEEQDFLIIPRGKSYIHLFQQALESEGIRCDVTGSNAFSQIEELRILIAVIKAIDDSSNQIHYLALLRDQLFGFSDAELYELKRAGGRFSYHSELPVSLEAQIKRKFEAANERLKKYQFWLRTNPFYVSMTRIASDLGLIANAAGAKEGNLQSGTFLRAMEDMRQHSHNFDSAIDMVTYMEQLLDAKESEGCSALPPDPNRVRIMNLHKAKGLESPIVFLADARNKNGYAPTSHIDRSESTPRGYIALSEKSGDYSTRVVAAPTQWSDVSDEEQSFLDAEEDRLLYVATTRAASMLVVSVSGDKSNWAALHEYLGEAKTLVVPAELSSAERKVPAQGVSSQGSSCVHLDAKWGEALLASYDLTTAKTLGLKGASRPKWQASGEYGYQWGTAVHELLEIAIKTPKIDLRAAAIRLAEEQQLAFDRVDELLSTVKAVSQSEIWKRSESATTRFSELPFETSTTDSQGKISIIRGVIDLIFEERMSAADPSGWVIVDYKTDDITSAHVGEAVTYYRNQLAEYARHWKAMTGFPVSEIGIYFTRIDRYVSC